MSVLEHSRNQLTHRPPAATPRPAGTLFWDDFDEGAKTELEVFFGLPPQQYAQLCLACLAEDFEMMLEDQFALPKELTIVEGVSVLPSLVAEVADPRQITFMVAYEEFQRQHYLDREFAREGFQDFSNPQVTFDNLMTANDILARSVNDSARGLGLEVIVIDDNRPLHDGVDIIERHFGLKEGYPQVTALLGGMRPWAEAGYPMEEAEE